MELMQKLFRTCVVGICLVLGCGSVLYYGFGLPHEAAIAIAITIAVIVGGGVGYSVTTIADITGGTLTAIYIVAVVSTVTFCTGLAAGALAVGSFIVGASVLAVGSFIAIALALQKDYSMPFGRVFGCLCAGEAAIGLGLYHLPEPAVVFRIGVAGLALMAVACFARFPRWLRRAPEA